MITTTQAYKDAIKNMSRRVVSKVDIYLDGESLPPTTLTDAVASMDILEETGTTGLSPLGSVSSNELTLELDNSNRDFLATNSASPYFGKLVPNVKVVPYIGVYIDSNNIEYIPMGVYWTRDWYAPSNAITASVSCYDIIGKIGAEDMPLIPVMQGLSPKQLLTLFLLYVGLTEADFEIDDSIAETIDYAWFDTFDIINTLNAIATAGYYTITADRSGKVRARSNYNVDDSLLTVTDTETLINTSAPQEFLKTYSSVSVTYAKTALGEHQQIINLADQTIYPGTNTFKNLTFSATPIAIFDRIDLDCEGNAYVSEMNIGASAADITIVNTTDQKQTVSIYGYGVPLVVNSVVHKVTNTVVQNQIGKTDLPVVTNLIQDLNTAKNYATILSQISSDTVPEITLEMRGDPAIEVTDTITVTNPSQKIGTVDVIVQRQQISYRGSLTVEITAVKKDNRLIYDWVMVSPGLFINVQRKL